MTDGRALCVEVIKTWSGLRFTVLERVAGVWTSRGFESLEPDDDALDRVVEDLEYLMRRANLVGEMGAAAGDEIVRLAALLFDELVPPKLKPILRSGSGFLTMRIDPGLHHIPWELLHDGRDFLARQYAFAREVTPRGLSELPPLRPLRSMRSVLVVADPRGDLPAAEREGGLLRESLVERTDVELGFLGGGVTRADLREVLREYEIVHFAGHAERDGEGGAWLVADGRFTADDIRRLAGTRPMPALIVSNGCSSGASSRDEDALPAAFLAAGTRSYLGTQWDIPDDVGILFAAGFYQRLTEGEPIGEALRRARIELAERFGEGTALWGCYVLYGSPEERYFPDRDLGAPTDLIDSALPGRRELRTSAPTIPNAQSPIAASPALRGAIGSPPELSVADEVARLERAAVLAVAVAFALVLAIAVLFMVGGESPEPATEDSVAVPVLTEAPSAEPRVPLGAALEVVAQLRDAQGHLRNVPLRSGDVLHSGDKLRLEFETSKDAHAYVFFVDGGRAQLLFPKVDGDVGEVSGGLPVELPQEGGWYWLDESPGPAALILAASVVPIEDLGTLVADIDELMGGEPSAEGGLLGGAETGTTSEARMHLEAVPIEQVRARISRQADRVVVFDIDHRP